jgi:hypothetical protein
VFWSFEGGFWFEMELQERDKERRGKRRRGKRKEKKISIVNEI